MNLAEQIRDRRKILGFRQKELAEKVGISRQYMCELEKGKYVPGVLTLMKLSEILNIEFKINKNGVKLIKT
jgi:transcriptional regulator with XRE-family HTH domain